MAVTLWVAAAVKLDQSSRRRNTDHVIKTGSRTLIALLRCKLL